MDLQTPDKTITDPTDEIHELEAQAKRFGVPIKVIQNADDGYVIQMQTVFTQSESPDPLIKPPKVLKSTLPVVAVDVDDTILGYHEAKQARFVEYMEFADNKLGYEVDRQILKRLMNYTNEFSRWHVKNENLYHFKVHQWVLSWLTQQLSGVPKQDLTKTVNRLEAELDRLKEGMSTKEAKKSDSPFIFDGVELILNNYVPYADIIDVFKPMLRPGLYMDTIDAVDSLARMGATIFIFTYGEFDFQFEKVLALREKLLSLKLGWPYKYIFLTTVNKGHFLERLQETAKTYPDLYSDIFNKDPHILLLLDDDKDKIENFMATSDLMEASTGARMCVVYALRDSIKLWENHTEITKRIQRAGHIPNQDSRRRVYINGNNQALDAIRSLDRLKPGHKAALSHLLLQIYRTINNNLLRLSRKPMSSELKNDLLIQRKYFSNKMLRIQRQLQDSN